MSPLQSDATWKHRSLQHGQSGLRQASTGQGKAQHNVQGSLAQPGVTSFTSTSNVPTQALPELM